MEAALRDQPKLRLLRVLKVVATVAVYCARNAGRLFLLVWFPCLLGAICQIDLDWLAYSYPPWLPGWLLSQHFNPPTWLNAITSAPWGAMAWAFVLSYMADPRSVRGLVTARIVRRAGLRFEFSRDVVLAAAIFAAVNLLDGLMRTIQFKLLVAGYAAFDLSDDMIARWSLVGHAIRVPIMVAVTVWSYLLAGHILRTGTFAVAYIWRLTRGNRLRLLAVFLLLSLATVALDQLAAPAINWLNRVSWNLQGATSWTLPGAMIRHFSDLPLSILWTVAYAVTVGLVLGALEWRR